jgi:hypothetical protein
VKQEVDPSRRRPENLRRVTTGVFYETRDPLQIGLPEPISATARNRVFVGKRFSWLRGPQYQALSN